MARGGIGGSGIYGGVGAGVVCDSKDTSMYCSFITPTGKKMRQILFSFWCLPPINIKMRHQLSHFSFCRV
jgi:hypothetical protein